MENRELNILCSLDAKEMYNQLLEESFNKLVSDEQRLEFLRKHLMIEFLDDIRRAVDRVSEKLEEIEGHVKELTHCD